MENDDELLVITFCQSSKLVECDEREEFSIGGSVVRHAESPRVARAAEPFKEFFPPVAAAARIVFCPPAALIMNRLRYLQGVADAGEIAAPRRDKTEQSVKR